MPFTAQSFVLDCLYGEAHGRHRASSVTKSIVVCYVKIAFYLLLIESSDESEHVVVTAVFDSALCDNTNTEQQRVIMKHMRWLGDHQTTGVEIMKIN